MKTKKSIIKAFIRLWPREVYDMKSNGKNIESVKNELFGKPGIYVLYRDEKPYYVGQAVNLWKRIKRHAVNQNSKQFHGWTKFSAFILEDKKYMNELEGLILSVLENETANGAKQKITKIPLPADARKALAKLKTIRL